VYECAQRWLRTLPPTHAVLVNARRQLARCVHTLNMLPVESDFRWLAVSTHTNVGDDHDQQVRVHACVGCKLQDEMTTKRPRLDTDTADTNTHLECKLRCVNMNELNVLCALVDARVLLAQHADYDASQQSGIQLCSTGPTFQQRAICNTHSHHYSTHATMTRLCGCRCACTRRPH
jgi:hypothetical protein